jgi:hypothetical protein
MQLVPLATPRPALQRVGRERRRRARVRGGGQRRLRHRVLRAQDVHGGVHQLTTASMVHVTNLPRPGVAATLGGRMAKSAS